MDDVALVLDTVGSQRTAFFGTTLGDRLALLFAATYPSRTSAVVAHASHPASLRDEDFPWGSSPEQRAQLLQGCKTGRSTRPRTCTGWRRRRQPTRRSGSGGGCSVCRRPRRSVQWMSAGCSATAAGIASWRSISRSYGTSWGGSGAGEIKTTGDGFLATFDGPARAIRAAHAIRAELTHHGLQVRVGLHTGEVELVGDDIGCIAVHIAARVRPGRGRLRLTDRGTHELKGVPDFWQLYAVELAER